MNVRNKIRQWNQIRQTRNELSDLSNRELQDLGISRSEIPFIARNSVK